MIDKKNNSPLTVKEIASQTALISWSERLRQHPAFDWIVVYGRYLILGAILLIAALLLIYRTSDQYSATAETDFASAAQAFAYFQREISQGANKEVVEGKTFQELQQILQRRPELHSKYDAPLAQLLLLVGDTDLAEKYAQFALARTSANGLPDYRGYSQTTLAIAQNKLNEALVQSHQLKQRMLEQASIQMESHNFGDLLYGYNLLRLALLHQQQGNRTEELALWRELKAYARWSQSDPASQILAPMEFLQLLAMMSEGNANLQSYIEQRENTLQP